MCDIHPWIVWPLLLWGQVGKHFPGKVGGGKVEELGSWLQNPSVQVHTTSQQMKNVKHSMQVTKTIFTQTALVSPLVSRQERVHRGHSAANF